MFKPKYSVGSEVIFKHKEITERPKGKPPRYHDVELKGDIIKISKEGYIIKVWMWSYNYPDFEDFYVKEEDIISCTWHR